MITSHHFLAVLPVLPQVLVWTEADFLQMLKVSVQQAGLHAVSELAFQFQPQGISAIVVLEESHVALHFWPEEKRVTIDIHTCDYHQDNYQKAAMLAELITTHLCDHYSPEQWHSVSVQG